MQLSWELCVGVFIIDLKNYISKDDRNNVIKELEESAKKKKNENAIKELEEDIK